jgi:hypothetical protein
MAVNTGVVVGTVGVVTLGVLKAVLIKGSPITPVIIGGYVAGLFISLLDLIPGAGLLAGGLMMLAFVAVLLSDTWWLGILGLGASGGQNEPITQTRTNPATGG